MGDNIGTQQQQKLIQFLGQATKARRQIMYDSVLIEDGATGPFILFSQGYGTGLSAFNGGVGVKTYADTNIPNDGKLGAGELFIADTLYIAYPPQYGEMLLDFTPAVAGIFPAATTDADVLEEKVRRLVGGVGGAGCWFDIKLGNDDTFFRSPNYIMPSGPNHSGIGAYREADKFDLTLAGSLIWQQNRQLTVTLNLLSAWNYQATSNLIVQVFLDGFFFRPSDYEAAAWREMENILNRGN